MSHMVRQTRLSVDRNTKGIAAVVLWGLLAGCALQPADRMPIYLGAGLGDGRATVEQPAGRLAGGPEGVIDAALLVAWDTSFRGSAPALPEDFRESLTQRLRLQLESEFPVRIVETLDPQAIRPGAGLSHLVQLSRERAIPYAVVAILSTVETETPINLPLSLESVYVLGSRTENHALAEVALVDGAQGRILLKAQGRAFSRMDRPDGNQRSNLYPVIQQSAGESPVYPDPARAHAVLRGITSGEALVQALLRLKDVWTVNGAS